MVNNDSERTALNKVELKTVLTNTCNDVASERTKKYTMRDTDSFNQRLSDVVETIEAIRSVKGATVEVGEDSFMISDYHIPKALLDYMSTGRIYASKDAVGKAEPVIEVERRPAKLSPVMFNKFFVDFNSYQLDGYKIPCVDQWTKEQFATLEEVQFLEDEEGRLAKLHEGGFDECTCALLGIRIHELSRYLSSVDVPTKDGFTTWLLRD